MIRTYGKAIVATLAAVLMTVYDFVDDQHIDTVEWVKIAIAFAIAIQTYLVPLTIEWPWMKTILAAVLSGLQVLVIVIVGGLTQQEIIELVIAIATPLGIGAAPAISHNGVGSNP
jgi:hypothetical protein